MCVLCVYHDMNRVPQSLLFFLNIKLKKGWWGAMLLSELNVLEELLQLTCLVQFCSAYRFSLCRTGSLIIQTDSED